MQHLGIIATLAVAIPASASPASASARGVSVHHATTATHLLPSTGGWPKCSAKSLTLKQKNSLSQVQAEITNKTGWCYGEKGTIRVINCQNPPKASTDLGWSSSHLRCYAKWANSAHTVAETHATGRFVLKVFGVTVESWNADDCIKVVAGKATGC